MNGAAPSTRHRVSVLWRQGLALGLWAVSGYAVLVMLMATAFMLVGPALALFAVGLVAFWLGLVCWRRAETRIEVLVEAGLWPDPGRRADPAAPASTRRRRPAAARPPAPPRAAWSPPPTGRA